MAIDDLKKVLNGTPSVTLQPPEIKQPDLDAAIKEDFALACLLFPDKHTALQAVISSRAKLPNALAALQDNRRSRYQADEPRAPYRPLTKDFAIRRLLLLTEIRKLQIEMEKQATKAGHLLHSDYWLRCYCQEMTTWLLSHTSWDTATAMTQVWRNYSAQETLDLYHSIADKRRSETKDSSSVSRTKDKIMTHQAKRFGSLLRLTEKKPFRFVARPSSPEEACSISKLFQLLLPLPPNQNSLVPKIIQQVVQDENVVEMNLNRTLTDIETFNKIASNVGVEPEENTLLVPEFSGITPSGPGRNFADWIPTSDLDLDRIKSAIHQEQSKQSRTVPHALSISVDGVTRGNLEFDTLSLIFLLEDSATVVDITTTNDDNEKFTLATYVLTYDGAAKTEFWNIPMQEFGDICIVFHYSPDDTVTAEVQAVTKTSAVIPPAPSVASAQTAAEQVEDRWGTLLRALSITEYPKNSLVAAAAADMNRLSYLSQYHLSNHSNVFIVGAACAGKSTLTAALVNHLQLRHSESFKLVDIEAALSPCDQWYHDHRVVGCAEERHHDLLNPDRVVTVINCETPEFERLALWDMPSVDNPHEIRYWKGFVPQPNLAIAVIDIARYNRGEAEQLIKSLKEIGARTVSIVLTKADTVSESENYSFSEFLDRACLSRIVEWDIQKLLEQAGYSPDTGSKVLEVSALDAIHGETKWNASLDTLLKAIPRALVAAPRNFAPQGWAFCNGALMPISACESVGSIQGRRHGYGSSRLCHHGSLVGKIALHISLVQRRMPRLSHCFVSILPKKKRGNVQKWIDECVAKQSQLLQQFLKRADCLGIMHEPAPRIYTNHDRLSRLFRETSYLAISASTAELFLSKYVSPNLWTPILVLEIAAAVGLGLLAREFGWSRRIYKEYRALDLAIAQAKVLLNDRGPVYHPVPVQERIGGADWREFAIAQAVWACLIGPYARQTPLSETQLNNLLCAFGKKPNKARKIARAIWLDVNKNVQQDADVGGYLDVNKDGRQNLFHNPRQLSMLLVRELGLTEQAAWALEESLGLPPIGSPFEGGEPQNTHPAQSCLA